MSTALTVKLALAPAVSVAGKPETLNDLSEGGLHGDSGSCRGQPVDGIGGGDRLHSGCLELHKGFQDSRVRAGEGKLAGQPRLGVAAGELDRAGVAGYWIAVSINRADRHVDVLSGGKCDRGARNSERVEPRGLDCDSCLGTHDGRSHGVRGRDRPGPRRLEDGGKCMGPSIGGSEGVRRR